MSSLNRRRSAVVLGVTASLLAAALTIRLAASWTASAAPLDQRPPDAAQLVARLQDEQARAAGLVEQLGQVDVQARELRTALAAAREKAASDAASAKDLTVQLARAKARLAALQAQLAAAAARQPATVTVTSAAAPAPAAPASHEDDEDEHEEHEDEDEDD